MLWLKFVHIAALVLWVAGLFYLPALLLKHGTVSDQQDFARVRLASRFAYLGIVSPAAFVAIGAGTALLFISDALHGWMFLKLVAVGVLVVAHMQYGHVLAKLAERKEQVPKRRLRFVEATVAAASLAILLLVLAKPGILLEEALPRFLLEPGVLRRPDGPPPVPHQSHLLLPQRP